MLRPTYAEVKSKVELDLDLQEETFISDAEMIGYCNEAIDEAEAEIHKLNEDYFRTTYLVPLVTGEQYYALPTDIYAHKIRRMTYVNGSTQYTIHRLRGSKKFETMDYLATFGSGEDYSYDLEHDATDGMELVLYPASRETSSVVVKMRYIRNAARVVDGTTEIDIPEFINFIYAFIKYKCLFKEGHANMAQAEKDMEKQRALMVSTLTEMVPDEADFFEKDVSHYEEMN